MGAEWVLWLLVALSIASIALIIDRVFFYKSALNGLEEFRKQIRKLISNNQIEEAKRYAFEFRRQKAARNPDFESNVVADLLESFEKLTNQKDSRVCVEILSEIAHDSILQTKLKWDKNLSILATIGNNAPFVGLFGTVLGIIQAFHDLSQQSADGATRITAGLSEALVATAIGIFVALPAVAAFNYFQRKVRSAQTEGESIKSLLIGKLADQA